MHPPKQVFILFALLAMSGGLAEPVEPAREAGARAGVTDSAPQKDVLEPDPVLTLHEALELAVLRNPALEAFDWELRASDARVLQAGLRPNPELTVEVEGIRLGGGASHTRTATSFGGGLPLASPPVAGWERDRESGDDSILGDTEITVTIAQLIELGSKRARRIALAREEKALVMWDYEVARADVLSGVSRAWYQVLVAQAAVELQETLLVLAQDITRTITARVDAGKVSPLEANKAEIALSNSEIAVARSRRDLAAAKIGLASWWGAVGAHFEQAEGALGELVPPPALEELARELESNPDVARWATEIAQREALVNLERAQRIVDPTLLAGFRSTGVEEGRGRGWSIGSDGGFSAFRGRQSADRDREHSLVVGLSVPLPLFDRNQGNIAASEALAAKARVERRQAQVRAGALLASAWESLHGAYDAVLRLETDVLPRAEESLEKNRRGYQEGKFAYLDVLDAQRTLVDARTTRLEQLANYHAARTEIERLTGQALGAWQAVAGK